MTGHLARWPDPADLHDCDPIPAHYRICKGCRQWRDTYAQSQLCDACTQELEEGEE
jgi:hypothetical protein